MLNVNIKETLVAEPIKPLKVVFAPGALESMEATIPADELQGILDEIKQLAESGTLLENSKLVDMSTLEFEDPELYAQLLAIVDDTLVDLTEDTPHTHPTKYLN